MTEVDSIARLLDISFNAVLLFLLWRVYQDFMRFMDRYITYQERLIDRAYAGGEPPPTQQGYRGPLANNNWMPRESTNLGEPVRVPVP